MAECFPLCLPGHGTEQGRGRDGKVTSFTKGVTIHEYICLVDLCFHRQQASLQLRKY